MKFKQKNHDFYLSDYVHVILNSVVANWKKITYVRLGGNTHAWVCAHSPPPHTHVNSNKLDKCPVILLFQFMQYKNELILLNPIIWNWYIKSKLKMKICQ